MSNKYKNLFDEYIVKTDIRKLLENQIINVNGKLKNIVKCNPDAELLDMCKELAVEKAKFTMAQNQAGKIRTPKEKEAKQFEGVLAETFSHIWLLLNSNYDLIERFDLERENFLYSQNEYDLIGIKNDKKYEFEIRNSYSYKTTIEDAYATLDTLGAYTNFNKRQEEISDLFIRPLLQCNPPLLWRKYTPSFESMDALIEEIISRKIILFLCCGTDKKTLINKGYETSFGQGSTKYLAIKMLESKDMHELRDLITNY